MRRITKEIRYVFYTNLILLILEIIALIHDVYAFRFGLFEWYTVDSNVLQLLVSGILVCCLLQDKPLPKFVTVMHFISAVGLTVTFLIAAFVLAPEGGIAYYFLSDVAPINHLSVRYYQLSHCSFWKGQKSFRFGSFSGRPLPAFPTESSH